MTPSRAPTTTQTVLRRHYMLTMRLDLTHLEEPRLQSLAQALTPLGVTVSTLQQQQAIIPDAVMRAYTCHNACRKKQPPVELRQELIPLAVWQNIFVEGHDALPELYLLALHCQEYIGVCSFERGEEPGTLVSGFTGVLPTWSSRGTAKALKAQGLLWAKQHGFTHVTTQNLVVNRGMCAINRSLGFQVVQKHLHSYLIPIGSEPVQRESYPEVVKQL